MKHPTVTKISARLWSGKVSLKPISRRLESVNVVYDVGDHVVTAAGRPLKARSNQNYLATRDVEIEQLAAVRREVSRHVALLENDPELRQLLDQGAIDAVVWVAIFGDHGTTTIEDLHINKTPFGDRIGLVVENYSDFDPTGNPRKLLIGRGAKSSSRDQSP